MSKSLIEFKKMINRFYNGQRQGYKSGSWSISAGGYDCWFQISYNGTPIIDCIDGNLYILTDTSFVEKDGYSINDVLRTLLNMGKNLRCSYIENAKDNKLIEFRNLVHQIHENNSREFSDKNWTIRVMSHYNLYIYYKGKLVIRVEKCLGIKLINSKRLLELEGYNVNALIDIIQKEYIDPIELTDAML